MKIKRIEKLPVLLTKVGLLSRPRQVAAYARVSTTSIEQGASLDAQLDYYEQYIGSRPNWQLVGVYYDSGISGLSHKNRDGFNRMIQDALDGKIDLIVTKSLSRFARNTVDTLTTIRRLKAAGIEVYFEKENIFTLDSKGEFLITLMSSMAQEESRSISENITWGQRKRFADGRYSVAYRHFLGYDQGGTNKLVINQSEAVTVRLIYRLFLEGKTERAISMYLEDRSIPSPGGKPRWHKNVVYNILSNEKYKGDALLQKSFTVDFLSKKMKKNEGELPKYYVEKGHEPIVSDEVFALVQEERAKRLSRHGHYSCKPNLSSKIICGVCGSYFGPKIAHSNNKYRHVFWRCNSFYDGMAHSPVVQDADLRECCHAAIVTQIHNHPDVVAVCSVMLQTYLPCLSVSEVLDLIMKVLHGAERGTHYEEKTCRLLVEQIEVSPKGTLRFDFIDGTIWSSPVIHAPAEKSVNLTLDRQETT